MADRAWKAQERRYGKFWGSRRTPLSGENSGHTGADIIHPRLYVEVKMRKKLWIHQLYADTKEKAQKEGKIPVLMVKQTGSKTDLVIVKKEDLEAVAGEINSSHQP